MSKQLSIEMQAFARITNEVSITEKKNNGKTYFVLQIPIASNTSYKNSKGEKTQKTRYMTLFEAFSKKPEQILPYLKVGKLVYFRGIPTWTVNTFKEKPQVNMTVQLDYFNLLEWEEN